MSEILTGYHAIEERLKGEAVSGVLHLARDNSRIERLAALARRRGVKIRRDSPEALDRLCAAADHRGAVLEVRGVATARRATLEEFVSGLSGERALVLALDGVTDPRNLGAVLRSADQFRVDLVLLPERRAAGATEAVARSSSGASSYVPTLTVTNLTRAIERLKEAGFWTYGADPRGERIDRVELSERLLLVMGSEGSGMSRLVAETCDRLVAIPSGGRVDSLNVSVAAGILLYEARRRQGFAF